MKISTNGDFVSEIRNHLKALNKDDSLSARYILSIAYEYITYLIKNRPFSSTMRDTTVFKEAVCVELQRVNYITCHCPLIEFKTCDKIMKSKKPIPSMFIGAKGRIIESILNIDGSEIYHRLETPQDYTKSKRRQFGKNRKYFYIHEDYLYLLNTTNEIVSINAMFYDEQEVDCLSNCADCDRCKSKLDNRFICPQEFLSTVRDQTLQLILSGNKRITEDTNPDLDNNQKGRTQ